MSLKNEILNALKQASLSADALGDYRIADESDKIALRIAQIGPIVKPAVKPIAGYLGADEIAGRLTGTSTPFANPKQYLTDTLLTPDNLTFLTLGFLENAKFDNMLRSNLINNGFVMLEDDAVWKSFKAERGRNGLETLLREVADESEANKILGKQKIPAKDMGGFWKSTFNRETVKNFLPNRAIGLNQFWTRHFSSLNKGGFDGKKQRAKLVKDFNDSGLPQKQIGNVSNKIAKNEFLAIMQGLSEKSQKQIATLIKEVRNGSFKNPKWTPALRQATEKVVEKNKPYLINSLKGIKAKSTGPIMKNVAKKLGPAIAVAAFTAIVEEYVEQDPTKPQSVTSQIPGGIAGSIVAYSLPVVGPALVAIDVGWSIGRIIANTPWAKEHLTELGSFLESQMSGIDDSQKVELDNQLSLENELDGGKYAFQMKKKFMDLVRSGVAIEQSWSAVLRQMKADGASPEAMLFVRKQYTEAKQGFIDTKNIGKTNMPFVPQSQEARALEDIKFNIDKLLAANGSYADVRTYLTKRLGTVADLGAKLRLQKSANQYINDRMNGAPATSIAPVAPAVSKPATPSQVTSLLSRGSRGSSVSSWQKFLSTQGLFSNYNSKTPQVFGSLTENGTKAFQAKHKLRVDGIVGPETIGKARELGATI
jgi:hypothetical protein